MILGRAIKGRVPPFVRETKAGNLLVSHDVMRSSQRTGSAAEGRVAAHSLVFPSQSPYTTLNRVDYLEETGPNQGFYQRRTNISTDFANTTDEHYVLAWLELDLSGANGGGNCLEFDLDQFALFTGKRLLTDQTYSDPSSEVLDPRAFLVDNLLSGPVVFEHMIATNTQPAPAQDDFEVFSWWRDDPAGPSLDQEFVPKPQPSMCHDLVDPRRTALDYRNDFPLLIVFDAKNDEAADPSLRSPYFYVKSL